MGGDEARAGEIVQDTTQNKTKVVYDPIDYSAVVERLRLASKPTLWQRMTSRLGKPLFENSTAENLRISGRAGVKYAPETNLSLVGAIAGEYTTDKSNNTTPPSSIALVADVSIIGFYNFGISGETYLPKGKDLFSYKASVGSAPIRFWGLGYKAGLNNLRTKYTRKSADAKVEYLREVVNDLWLGAGINYTYLDGRHFEPLAVEYLSAKQLEQNIVSTVGFGLRGLYDKRNSKINTTSGYYLSLKGELHPSALANHKNNILHIEAIADFYLSAWEGGVVAADFYADLWSSATPWMMLPSIGGSTRMRGYYYGRYIDSKTVSGQVEVRQHIYGPFGVCAWGGAAKVFPSFKTLDLKHILPNGGLGIRIALGDGTSLRVDYGFGRHSNELIININEAF